MCSLLPNNITPIPNQRMPMVMSIWVFSIILGLWCLYLFMLSRLHQQGQVSARRERDVHWKRYCRGEQNQLPIRLQRWVWSQRLWLCSSHCMPSGHVHNHGRCHQHLRLPELQLWDVQVSHWGFQLHFLQRWHVL